MIKLKRHVLANILVQLVCAYERRTKGYSDEAIVQFMRIIEGKNTVNAFGPFILDLFKHYGPFLDDNFNIVHGEEVEVDECVIPILRSKLMEYLDHRLSEDLIDGLFQFVEVGSEQELLEAPYQTV